MRLRIIICFIGLWVLLVPSLSQAQMVVQGQVFRTGSDLYLPFTHVMIGNHKKDILTDEEGRFSLTLDEGTENLTFKSFMHRTKTIEVNEATDSLKVFLNQNELFVFLKDTDPGTEKLIHGVIDYRKTNNPHTHRPYHYTTYSKFFLTTDNIKATKSKLKKILHKFSIDFNDIEDDHHILLTEATTERSYMNKVCESEIITASKVSGVKEPSVFTVSPQLQPFSIYENVITIMGSHYTSPITKNTLKRYAFQVLDTIPRQKDSVFVVKFNSKINKRFEGLKGLLFINSYKYGIEKMILEPTIDRSLGTKVVKTNQLLNDSIWFPKSTKTILTLFNLGIDKMNFTAIAQTDIKEIRFDTMYQRKAFSEVVYHVDEAGVDKDSAYWANHRTQPLTHKDKETYTFYDTVGTLKNFDKILRFTERAYFKKIPYKFLDIDSKRIVALNKFEGLRLGLGAHTNEKVSNLLSIGGYFAYGFKDKRWKYGGDISVHLNKEKELRLYAGWRNDVLESGRTLYTYDAYQYSSEGARKLRVRRMDRIKEYDFGLFFRLFEYVRSNISLVQSRNDVPYTYAFQGEFHPSFTLTELRAGFKYTYGEKYLRIHDTKISLGSRFPKVWVQYTKGFDNFWGGDYAYDKYDAKIEYKKHFLGVGTMNLQLTAGYVDSDLPYYKLHNGKGSLEVGAVAHNSFQTMRYNEFLSSSFVSLFYTQQFGKLNFVKFKNYSPVIEMLHSFGIGTLRYPGSHNFIDFKTMERGYFESGISINKLIMIKTPPIRSGLGVAYFYRYGYYAASKFIDNSFIKVSFNFAL